MTLRYCCVDNVTMENEGVEIPPAEEGVKSYRVIKCAGGGKGIPGHAHRIDIYPHLRDSVNTLEIAYPDRRNPIVR